MAIWHLRHTWNRDRAVAEKLTTVAHYIHEHGTLSAVEQYLEADLTQMPQVQRAGIREEEILYRIREDDIPF